MTGYQQGVLKALGSWNGDKFAVRSLERWYCDNVSELFGTTVYASRYNEPRDGAPQWCVKSSRIDVPELSSVTDWQGFCRAWIEIHGTLDLSSRRRRDGTHYRALRLRLYGGVDVLTAIGEVLPAAAKKLQTVRNSVSGGYIGETYCLYYQNPSEVLSIIDYIDGEPRNTKTWEKWRSRI